MPNGTGRLQTVGRALRHRNYRLFFTGQLVSMIGTWLTRVATGWLVYRLTGSAFLLGIVGFAGQLPTFLLAPIAGVLVDRWDRHRVLVVTQVLAMVQSALLAGLALANVITVWHVVLLNVFQGFINAFDMPARQAFVVEMIEDRADLPNAIALNSSLVNAARLLGPSFAGIIIAAVGEGWCFAIDAVSYLAVIASLLLMKVPKREVTRREKHVGQELAEGFRYAVGFKPIRAVLLLLAIVSLVGMPYTVLMPVLATDLLHGNAGTLGFLMGASGFGALCGALYLASRQTVLGLGRLVIGAAALFGVGLVAFSRSHVMWLSMPLMLVTGAGFMIQMASSNTILQTIADEGMRGRLMSFYSMAFFGTAPFGSLAAGALAQRIGAANTVMLGGVVTIVAAIYFGRQLPHLAEMVRPIYRRLGILPAEMAAEGAQAATQMTVPPEGS